MTTALAGDYERFFEAEEQLRSQLGYPPFGRLGRVIVDGISEEKVSKGAAHIARILELGADGRLLGPSPAPLNRLRNRYRWHMLILVPTHAELLRALRSARQAQQPGVRVNVRVDPVQLL